MKNIIKFLVELLLNSKHQKTSALDLVKTPVRIMYEYRNDYKRKRKLYLYNILIPLGIILLYLIPNPLGYWLDYNVLNFYIMFFILIVIQLLRVWYYSVYSEKIKSNVIFISTLIWVPLVLFIIVLYFLIGLRH